MRLNDGRFLRISITLFREPHEDGHRMKVEHASYQYQSDDVGNRWIVRYDYRREADEPHPASHVQIHGELWERVPLPRVTLERVHFPTGRVSLEAVIRMLIEQFGVPTKTTADIWRRILAETEAAFDKIAHRPLSGPAGELGKAASS